MQRLLIYPLPLLSQRSKGQRLVEPITTNVAGTSGVTHFPDLREGGEKYIQPCSQALPSFLQIAVLKSGRGADYPLFHIASNRKLSRASE